MHTKRNTNEYGIRPIHPIFVAKTKEELKLKIKTFDNYLLSLSKGKFEYYGKREYGELGFLFFVKSIKDDCIFAGIDAINLIYNMPTEYTFKYGSVKEAFFDYGIDYQSAIYINKIIDSIS